jgi:hypothetical protein
MELTDRIESEERQIGSIGTPDIKYDSLNNRVKGFAGEGDDLLVVENFSTAQRLQDYVDYAIIIAQQENATRITLRTITTDPGLLQGIRNADIEAVVPFTFDGTELSMVYLGRNNPSRLTPGILFERQSEMYQQIIARDPRESRVQVSPEYLVEMLESPSDEEVRDVITLMEEVYSRDGEVIMWYTPTVEDVRLLLEDSTTYVARHLGNIVSMCVAEVSRLKIFGETVNIYEVSDCATSLEHRGQGLIQACAQGVLDDIRGADIIYNESRVAHTPIIRAMRNLGFIGDGILRNHVKIGGDRDLPEISDIESLAVMYIRSENDS